MKREDEIKDILLKLDTLYNDLEVLSCRVNKLIKEDTVRTVYFVVCLDQISLSKIYDKLYENLEFMNSLNNEEGKPHVFTCIKWRHAEKDIDPDSCFFRRKYFDPLSDAIVDKYITMEDIENIFSNNVNKKFLFPIFNVSELNDFYNDFINFGKSIMERDGKININIKLINIVADLEKAQNIKFKQIHQQQIEKIIGEMERFFNSITETENFINSHVFTSNLRIDIDYIRKDYIYDTYEKLYELIRDDGNEEES